MAVFPEFSHPIALPPAPYVFELIDQNPGVYVWKAPTQTNVRDAVGELLRFYDEVLPGLGWKYKSRSPVADTVLGYGGWIEWTWTGPRPSSNPSMIPQADVRSLNIWVSVRRGSQVGLDILMNGDYPA